ncbi:MAG: DegT/DnrJ/EryC1/StrS family aminotransferase [Verrucomicrobiales bacterium]
MKEYRLSEIDMGEEEALAVAEVVRSKWLSVGPRTAEFEERFAREMGVDHAVAVSSCTTALHLALLAAEVGPGDEVLVPSYTFVASANAVVYQGATPVFVDINGAHDLNLDVEDLERKITSRTKAIIPVHMAGFPADLDRIMELAETHGLAVVEDACHAIGADYQGGGSSPYRGRKAGTIGHVGCFSFFGNKNLVTGEGGMLVTDDADLAARVRLARSHGMSKTSWDKAEGRAMDYDVVGLGYNYRSTELTAALGLIQLGKLAAANRRRKALAARYRKQLVGVAGITIPFADRLEDSAHHIFPVVLDDPDSRTPFRLALRDKGIQTSVHYPPVHRFSFYRDLLGPDVVRLERTEDVAAREVTLPLHPLLEEDDADFICEAVAESLTPALA